MPDPIYDCQHLVAQVLAEDHADCDPDECEFVGEESCGISEFDHTATG